jgi:acetyl esterase/lipase
MRFFVFGIRPILVFLTLSLLRPVGLGFAQDAPAHTVPERTLPIPSTVSPELQKAMARTCKMPGTPPTMVELMARIHKAEADSEAYVGHIQKDFDVSVEEGRLGGVRIYDVKPAVIAEENRHRLLMNVHGGGYISGRGVGGTSEAVYMAYYGKIEVIAVDYRMPPEFPFPAAVDDSVAVWKEIIKTHTPNDVGIFGTSAGGGLTLATVLRLKELGLPLPGAIMAGTPWSDLTKTGDSYFTNEYVDNALCTYDGDLGAAAKLYAGGHDLKEPLLSPVYGDLSGFPPTVLVTGTRDLFLSNTVRVHQKLLQSGVEAELLVFEAQSHAQYYAEAPETAAAHQEVVQFFDRHLGR